jgi:hypothetical protein
MKNYGGRKKEKPSRDLLLRVFEEFGFRLCDPHTRILQLFACRGAIKTAQNIAIGRGDE